MLHGRPASRLFCPDRRATEETGVRLITIDRPGYGLSDPRPGRTFRDWGDDYAELADHLDLPACAVLGWSGGGPYALACAAFGAERVSSVGLVATETPSDEDRGAWDDLLPETRALFELLRRDPDAAMDGVRRRYRGYADGWESWVATFGTNPADPDFSVESRPDVRAALVAQYREGARQGATGLVEDSVAVVRPWGFSPTDVTRPVHIFWGEVDPIISLKSGRWLANAIPGSRLTVYPREGHMIPVTHWAEMLRALR
jgi:pimeloyl-ACP methyl ester carboxylesterase